MVSTTSPGQSDVPAAATARPHQAIYRRWRAQTFSQIVGQAAVVQTLQNAVRTERVAHAVLFVGPRGTGKTSLARILAKAVNCTNLQDGDPCDNCPSCTAIREGRAMDLVEIDAASNRGIDAIRELRERINYAPTDLKRKVYILDEAHQITKDAWNALLKSLEEPPDFVIFMFASTHPQDFPPAILSRLQRFDVRRLTIEEIEGKLRRILEGDGRVAEPGAIHLIAQLAAGGMRDAESMLDQLLASGGEHLDEAMVRDLLGLAAADTVDGFVAALIGADVGAGVGLLDELENRGRDLRAFLDQVVDRVRGGLIGRSAVAAGSEPLDHAVADLVPIARRLASIDPNRAGIGGLRLQLELALFPLESKLAPGPAKLTRPPEPKSAGMDVVGAPEPVAVDVPTRAPARGATRPAPASVPAPESVPTDAGPPPAARRDGNAGRETATAPGMKSGPKGVAAGPGAESARLPTIDSAGPTFPDPTRPVVPSRTEVPPPPPVSPGAGSDIDVLRSRWSEVVTRVSAHPPTKPLIAVCRPISVEDGIVTLGFPEDQGFLRDVAERRRSVLEEGIGAILGRSVGVRCVATNLDLVPAVPDDADAAFILAEARRIFETEEPGAAEVS